MSFFGAISRGLNLFFGRTSSAAATVERAKNVVARQTLYAINDSLYDADAYHHPQHWRLIQETYLPQCDPRAVVYAHFSPFKEIVEAYQNVLPGTLGQGIDVDDQFDNKPVKPEMAASIRQVWRDSNLDTTKQEICRYGANLGTVGLRAYLHMAADEQGRPRPVALVQHHHPAWIFDVETDGRGNCETVALKYMLPRNTGTPLRPVYLTQQVEEIISKFEFSRRVDGVETLNDEQRKNNFGFCPYVILNHLGNGTIFGDWAYKGSEPQVHAINYRLSQQDRSIGRGMFARWVFGAGGDKPVEIDVSGEKAIWIRMNKDHPTPFAQAIVPDIQQDHAQSFWMELRDMLRGRQPELTINDVRMFAGISGETIAQVLKPAEAAIQKARANYDHAMIRVINMAVSLGAINGAFQLGTGQGAAAGDVAYRSGVMNWKFKDRPLLPPTPQSTLVQTQAAHAEENARFAAAKNAAQLGVGEDEILRIAGYDEKQVQKIRQNRAKRDVIPTVEQ